MKKTTNLFFVILLLHLSCIFFNYAVLRDITKCTLVPLLLVYLARHIKPVPILPFLALLFSWIGDCLLIGSSDHLFLLGMLSFALAHVLYSFFFLQKIKRSFRTFSMFLFVMALLAIICLLLFQLLEGHLGAFRLPVIGYMVVIGIMTATCITAAFSNPQYSLIRIVLLSGAVLFVSSDALLAINKFVSPQIELNIMVMLSYALAQYALVKGCIGMHTIENKKSPVT